VPQAERGSGIEGTSRVRAWQDSRRHAWRVVGEHRVLPISTRAIASRPCVPQAPRRAPSMVDQRVVMPSREVTREDVVPPMETWWIAASSLKASADKQVVVGWVEREGGQGREEG
jgi:hypothetical protein